MLPQIRQRKIGKIRIIDIEGDLVGPWAVKAKNELRLIIRGGTENVFVVNLKQLHDIDSLGVKAITESLPSNRKTALFNGNLSVMDMLHASSLPQELQLLRNEDDLVRYFGEELVASDETDDERRKHGRMSTALPVALTCMDSDGRDMKFQAIATSLSEGGIFVEYINLDDAVKSQEFVNPYELKMLSLKIKFPNQDNVLVKGKVVRRKLDGEQVGIGIEFYQIEEADRSKVKDFLGASAQLNGR